VSIKNFLRRKSGVALLHAAVTAGVLALIGVGSAQAQYTTVNDPNIEPGTGWISGISGSTVSYFGYDLSSNYIAQTYNGSTFTSIQGFTNLETLTSGSAIVGHTVDGISYGSYASGSNTVGYTWDGTTLVTIDNPNNTATDNQLTVGAQGGNIYGNYTPTDLTVGSAGYIYNGSTFTSLYDPLQGSIGLGTVITGVNSTNIYGGYYDNSGIEQGFIYNGSSFQTISDPNAVNATVVFGTDGNNIVGTYYDGYGYQHGFVYNTITTTYTTLDDPLSSLLAGGTYVTGISGNLVVGNYYDSVTGLANGFSYEINSTPSTPEPGSLALLAGLGIAGAGFVRKRRNR